MNFAAVAQAFRFERAEERREREERIRTVELLSKNAEHDAHFETLSAADAIKLIPQTRDYDLVVLLNAIAVSVRRHNMHQDERQEFVREIEGLAMWIDAKIEMEREQ